MKLLTYLLSALTVLVMGNQQVQSMDPTPPTIDTEITPVPSAVPSKFSTSARLENQQLPLEQGPAAVHAVAPVKSTDPKSVPLTPELQKQNQQVQQSIDQLKTGAKQSRQDSSSLTAERGGGRGAERGGDRNFNRNDANHNDVNRNNVNHNNYGHNDYNHNNYDHANVDVYGTGAGYNEGYNANAYVNPYSAEENLVVNPYDEEVDPALYTGVNVNAGGVNVNADVNANRGLNGRGVDGVGGVGGAGARGNFRR